MGLLRKLAHTLFGLLLLTALWLTALSLLTTRASATGVITDLGVDALNPWLVSQGFGVSEATYAKLEASAAAHPGAPLPLAFLKPQVTGGEIVGRAYRDGLRVIYGHAAGAYYDGGLGATFSLPPVVTEAAQTFALFSGRVSAAAQSATKSATQTTTLAPPLPSWLRPFLVYTGLAPDTFTAGGHARILGALRTFWLGTAVLAGVIFLLSFLSRRPPLRSVALAVVNATWPALALFGAFWLLGALYPARVQPVAGAFGVVAGAFVPVYGAAAVAGLGVYLLSRFGAGMFKAVGRRASPRASLSWSARE